MTAPVPSGRGSDRRYMARVDRTRRLFSRIFAFLTIASGLYYIVWAFRAVNPAHPVVGALFLGAEICCLSLFAIATIGVWRLRFKPAASPAADRDYSVDLFVPVCGEPLEIVAKTLAAVKAIEWRGPLRVYVLDDSPSSDVRKLTARLGFEYRSRPREGVDQAGSKAGNLNFGLANSSGELFLVLDADQVPAPNIIEAMVGYMAFAKVAFVQSRQTFHVPEDDPFFNNDPVFYEALQLGLDSGNSVISCGSGVLYRRAALEDIGGFVTWNIVEDLTTSYELRAAGWKSFYYPFPLSVGLAPSDIRSVYQQRGQWALDTMRLFFWDNPLFKRGLDWFGRAAYLILGLTYASSAFVFPFFFLVPVWSYLTGGNVLNGSELEFASVRGAYFVAMAIAMQLLFRGRQPGKQFQMLTGLFPIYAYGTLRAHLVAARPQAGLSGQQRRAQHGAAVGDLRHRSAVGDPGRQCTAAVLRDSERRNSRSPHRHEHSHLGAGDLVDAAGGPGDIPSPVAGNRADCPAGPWRHALIPSAAVPRSWPPG